MNFRRHPDTTRIWYRSATARLKTKPCQSLADNNNLILKEKMVEPRGVEPLTS